MEGAEDNNWTSWLTCREPVDRKMMRMDVTKRRRSHNVSRRVQLSRDVTVQLTSFADSYYYGEVYIGTPGQPVGINFDTGSSDFWVGSRHLCTSFPEYCNTCGHSVYDHDDSDTYQEDGRLWQIGYQDGSFYKGFISKDDFEIAGADVEDQLFAEVIAINHGDSSCQEKFDGLLGLGYPDYGSPDILRRNLPLLNMVCQGVIDEPVFAFYLTQTLCYMNDLPLARTWFPESQLPEFPDWLPTFPSLWDWWSDSEEGPSAQLVMGGFDPDHFTGDLTFTPVVSSTAWLIAVQRVFVGDREIRGDMMALVDSGTTLIYLPDQMFNMFSQISGTKDYIECSKINTLPTLFLVISQVRMTLEPSDYVLRVKPNVCEVGVKPSTSESMFILGDVWMRKYYTVFDMGNHRVGFAPAA